MNNQGFFGALEQFWTIEEKPRLNRRNSYFSEVELSNLEALRVGVAVSVIATAIIVFWSLGGIL